MGITNEVADFVRRQVAQIRRNFTEQSTNRTEAEALLKRMEAAIAQHEKDERKAFEAWALDQWRNSYPPDNAWRGWQARAVAEAARKAVAAKEAAAGGQRWYLGSMNDGLFIIDRPATPAGTDVGPWDNPNGPQLALNVAALTPQQAQAIIDLHNASLNSPDPHLSAAADGQQGIPISEAAGAKSDGQLPIVDRGGHEPGRQDRHSESAVNSISWERRERDLLEANNRYLNRARLAEAGYAKHETRGSHYRMIAYGKLQSAAPISEGCELVAYQGEGGSFSFRPVTEFSDGRFSPAIDRQTEPECHKLDTPTQVFFYEQDFYVLSNFSSFQVILDGIVFDTSEAAYHFEKFPGSPGLQQKIQLAPSAHEAFKLAERNKHLRRPDWDDVKVDIMRDILRAKVDQHEYVRRKLLATGDRELIEDSWRDDFWGWGPNRDGKNMLGRLWMEIRAELRAAAKGDPCPQCPPGAVCKTPTCGRLSIALSESSS
ncbi:hypothetical protein MesoLjLc_51100 [Mesorhizobium sp. L-8-10]|uniref:NADAR family protein n=1 Tax=Mesorhizobium sp. L-8-10 TaxID=2744523 RepID=UPI0019272C73|nr:NADAR family protein [Mesorhizobium sp. L-8-10]BCH33180.1 hypothetical protein MesoLjLc_51100 [Mesorhizobium sp. L-8-10]